MTAAKQSSNERGMTTAEYAVGTVAVATGVGVVLAIATGPTVQWRVFWPILDALIRFVLRLFGTGG